jgi:hypothetical protein
MKILNYHTLSYPIEDMLQYIPSGIKLANKNYFGYNLASVPIPGTPYELYCVRFTVKQPDRPSASHLIVPGNLRGGAVFTGYYPNKREIPGENFWWSRWAKGGLDCSFLFIGQYDGTKIAKLSPFKKVPLATDSLFVGKINRVGTDHRLININGILYAHSRSVHYMIEVKPDPEKMIINFGGLMNLSQANKMTNEMHRYLNASLVKVVNEKTLLFVNMFDKEIINQPSYQRTTGYPMTVAHQMAMRYRYPQQVALTKPSALNGVKFIELDIADSKKSIIDKHLVFYKKDKPYCFGSKTEPLFSFGSPSIEFEPGKFLSVGHIKIKQKYATNNLTTLDYTPQSKIIKIRDQLHNIMHDTFDKNYVTHYGHKEGYIYMTFFYHIDTTELDLLQVMGSTNPPIRMYISDPFLPINLDKDHCSEIKSSLIFSLGLFEKNFSTESSDRLIHVTSGECDFYSTVMTFELTDAVKSCKHNLENFSFEQFNYHLLPYYDNKSFDLILSGSTIIEESTGASHESLQKFLQDKGYSYKIEPASRKI